MRTTIELGHRKVQKELRQRVPPQGITVSCSDSDLKGLLKVVVLRHDLVALIVLLTAANYQTLDIGTVGYG